MFVLAASAAVCANVDPNARPAAAQHHRALLRLMGPLAEAGTLGAGDGPATRVALVTGSLKTAARREALLALASGEAGIAGLGRGADAAHAEPAQDVAGGGDDLRVGGEAEAILRGEVESAQSVIVADDDPHLVAVRGPRHGDSFPHRTTGLA